jgi:Ferritin-like domain
MKMHSNDENPEAIGARREFLRNCTGMAASAGALALLGGCNDKYGAAVIIDPKATPTPAPSPGPTYTPVDTDYLNFVLQIQYLVTAFFWRSAFGGSVDSALVTGAGTAGSVSGGAQVQFADDFFLQGLREIALDSAAQLKSLRTLLGSGVTAQPAINIAGGNGSPFDAIASRDAFPTGSPFDPYASLENYLLGATGISWLGTSAFRGVVFRLASSPFKDALLGMIAAKAHHDTFLRLALWRAGRAKTALFETEDKMVLARNNLNGGDGTYLTANYETGVGKSGSTTIVMIDVLNSNTGTLLGRTPELVLNIAYASRKAVASGAFFPGGVNGLIKYSNAAGA